MKKLLLLLCLAASLASCVKDKMEDLEVPVTEPEEYVPEQLPQMVLGEQLENPYSLENMQAAYDEMLNEGFTGYLDIKVTDLYVRFLPKDSTELRILEDDLQLELFDYPLDYDIVEEGAFYHDPDIPEDKLTWMYTTVKADFVFPASIEHEVLQQCYIPADDEYEEYETEDEELTRSSINKVDPLSVLEYAAFKNTGLAQKFGMEDPATRGWINLKRYRPEGNIKVYNDSLNVLEPVKGVKVRCHTLVKWSTTFTNEWGYYKMDGKFRIGPHYALVFDNSKGFDIYGNWGPLARANYNMGWHSKKGHDRDIYKGSQAWDWCIVNNAGYEYYQMCEQTGISKPPHNLKVWVFRHKSNMSSAPMASRISHVYGIKPGDALVRFLNNWYINIQGNIILAFFRNLLPDVTIGSKGSDAYDIYNTVNHEFAHASHFSQVGSAYWADYISYIITYGSYGSREDFNSGVCEIGELWGCAMGEIQEYEKYRGGIMQKKYMGYKGWFNPAIIWDLYAQNILTKKEIYDCLTSDVKDIYALRDKMLNLYAAEDLGFPANGYERRITTEIIYENSEGAGRINSVFKKYGFGKSYDTNSIVIIRNDTSEDIFIEFRAKPNISMQYVTSLNVYCIRKIIKPGESTKIFSCEGEASITALTKPFHSVFAIKNQPFIDSIKSTSLRNEIMYPNTNLYRILIPGSYRDPDPKGPFLNYSSWTLSKESVNNETYNSHWTYIINESDFQ